MHQHPPDHCSRCRLTMNIPANMFVDRSDAFDLEVVGGPERKITSGEDRSDGWPTSTSERDVNGKGYVP